MRFIKSTIRSIYNNKNVLNSKINLPFNLESDRRESWSAFVNSAKL